MKGKVSGENYPIPPTVELLQSALQMLQLLVMALMIFGDGFWTNVLRFPQVPEWYYPFKAYGFPLSLAIFFVLPQALNRYIITGAFEIFVDGVTVFSKLQSGRMPNVEDIAGSMAKFGLVPMSSR